MIAPTDIQLERARRRGVNASDIPDDEIARLRVPPHSVEAEQSVLGGILLDNAAFSVASELLVEADFFRYEHRLIFSAMALMVSDGLPVDPITVFERLQQTGRAEDAQGLPYLNALAMSVPSAANMRRYAQIVRERAVLRRLIAATDEIASAAFNPAGQDLGALLERAQSSLSQIARADLAPRRVPLLGLDALREASKAVRWLVKHAIPADSIGVLFGGSGTFKSFIALDAALHIAHGLPWMGKRTEQGPVIYIAAEGGSGLWPRIVAWHRARGLRWDGVPLFVVPSALDLGTDAWRVVEAAQLAGVQPAMVIVDTLSQTYSGEENSANEMAAYLRELGARFRQLWHCAVLVIHHSGHQATERPRGSSAIRANVDFMFGVHRDEKAMIATLSCAKQKDGECFEDEQFSMTRWTLGQDDDGEPMTSLVADQIRGTDELLEKMAVEAKRGRGGNNQRLLDVLEDGQAEKDARAAFMEACGDMSTDAKKQAWSRALRWAASNGIAVIQNGRVQILRRIER